MARVLLNPDTHRPQNGLTSTTRELRILVQNFSGLSSKDEDIKRFIFHGDHVLCRRLGA